jgi:indolepyruvate ferredoxin oxidoreductase
MRILRKLMPDWHKEEKRIATSIRKQVLDSALNLKRLKELDSIKGYREYRYQNASKFLGSKA